MSDFGFTWFVFAVGLIAGIAIGYGIARIRSAQ